MAHFLIKGVKSTKKANITLQKTHHSDIISRYGVFLFYIKLPDEIGFMLKL